MRNACCHRSLLTANQMPRCDCCPASTAVLAAVYVLPERWCNCVPRHRHRVRSSSIHGRVYRNVPYTSVAAVAAPQLGSPPPECSCKNMLPRQATSSWLCRETVPCLFIVPLCCAHVCRLGASLVHPMPSAVCARWRSMTRRRCPCFKPPTRPLADHCWHCPRFPSLLPGPPRRRRHLAVPLPLLLPLLLRGRRRRACSPLPPRRYRSSRCG